MCTTQKLTITDDQGRNIQVEDMQDCGRKTCQYSAHWEPRDDQDGRG